MLFYKISDERHDLINAGERERLFLVLNVPIACLSRGRKAFVTRTIPCWLMLVNLTYGSFVVNSTAPPKFSPALFTTPHRPA